MRLEAFLLHNIVLFKDFVVSHSQFRLPCGSPRTVTNLINVIGEMFKKLKLKFVKIFIFREIYDFFSEKLVS